MTSARLGKLRRWWGDGAAACSIRSRVRSWRGSCRRPAQGGRRYHVVRYRACRHGSCSSPSGGDGKNPGGGVGFKGLFGPDGLNPIGRSGARFPGSGKPNQQVKLGGTVGHHNQRNDIGGEDGLPHQQRRKHAGDGQSWWVTSLCPPPQLGETVPGPPGGPKGPRWRWGEGRMGKRGAGGATPPHNSRRLGSGTPGGTRGTPGGTRGTQGLQEGRMYG